jgi:2',3'-cyclic-nucleotide 2'-phosphodiesterase (5'-nucleotidase family)
MVKKNFFRIITLFIATLLLSGVSSCNNSKKINFTVLHTNDLHSAFNSSKELTERNPFGLGGLANLSTLIKQNKTDNTVLVDAGDWSEGNAYYFVDAGTNMLQALELLGYDATVVGNHDFLNGPIEMANTVQRANLKKLKVLGLNKNLENEALSAYKEYIEKNILNYSITSLPNGLRIAFIGLLCVDLDYRDYFKPGILTDAIKAASRALTEIRSQNLADVIIILSHNKFELNLEWAKLISDQNGIGPDIIISGHSHVKTPKIKTVLNASRPVLVAEAGYWGQFLGRMDLQYNTGTKTVELKNYNLIPVTPTSNPDPEILKFIEEQNKKLNEKFSKVLADNKIKVNDITKDVIAEASDEFPHGEYKETAIGNLLADVYRNALRTDIAFEVNSLVGISFSAGPITLWDILSVQPHIYSPLSDDPRSFPEKGTTWRLKIMKALGSDIKLVLNAFLKANTFTQIGWISVSGMKIYYNLKNVLPIEKISIIDRDTHTEKPLQDNEYYTIAMHDGLIHALSIIDNVLPIKFTLVEDPKMEAWVAIYKYLRSVTTIHPHDYIETSPRYISTISDLMIENHLVRIYKTSSGRNRVIEIAIRNIGNEISLPNATLEAYQSNVNDMINDGTDNCETIPFFDKPVSIPMIQAGGSYTFFFNVNNAFTKNGIYSIKFKINSNDGNPTNNTMIKYFKIDDL